MKLKKMLISLIGVMAVATITLQSGVYAKKSTTSKKYIGPTILWENSQPKEGYHYGIHSADNNAIDIEIWNLIQYTDSNLNTYANHNFYCLKGRRGLKDEKDGKFYGVYNLLYDDMVADRSQILDDNAILKEINKNTITINGKEINRYNAILAVLDMMYVPAESPEGQTEELLAEKKELIHTLLSKALENELIGNIGQINSGINLMAKAFDFDPVDYEYEVDFIRDPEKYKECNLTEYALTDNDINAIQQAVLWYFTNYYTEIKTGENEIIENPEEKSTAYDKTQDSQNWIYYTQSASGNDWEALQEVNNIQEERPRFARALQAHALYLYMVNEAIENAHLYGDTATINQPPVEVKETELEGEISGNNYIIGPIQIESKNPNKQYEINIDVKNEGNKVSNYKILDSQKKDVQNIKDLIEKGEDIYISIPKDEVSSITIDIDVKYNDKTMKLIASSTNANEQPIAEIEKTDRTISKQLTFVPEEKPFDLALRKYIVKINDEPELSGNDSRVPVIDASKLNAGENPETTAEYKHKKYPVTIKTGDKVTYKMTIYNEGEKAGRATEVVDQLPEGLKFLRVVDGKFKEASYDEETNKLTLIRDNNNDNLNPFTEGAAELASETITIECEVTAEPDTENSKILTNVAWISKSIDEDGKETNDVGDDRDSLPSKSPDVNKGNMEDYKGDDANDADLSRIDYHYKGKQDDDDFEKLILKPEIFDLALRKFITSVNDKTVPERIILNDEDVKDLNSLDENGNVKATTANYHESKDPITVKNGDIVTYTLRVYNEGTLDGYAQKVTEDIPEGLEFIWSEKQGEELEADKTLTDEEKKAIEFNQKYLWGDFEYDESGKIIKTTSDYLSKENETTVGGNLLEAFGWNDGTKTKDDLKYKDIQIKLKVVAQNVTGEAIRNEAAITDDADEEGKPIDPDRDSEPENWNEHPDHQDDEDHDYIILQSFDLALRKFIVAISKDTKIESNEELRNAEGLYTRAPVVDTSKLNMADENGNKITTATYNHTKEPVMVAPNDIVVYMLRVYNEGDMNGYAAEIKDHLPPYLEFVEGEYNKQYGWEVSEDGRTVTTKYLENSLIKKPETDENGTIVLSYQEVPIMCKVSANPKTSENITNIADITKYLDENKQPVTDRDSQPDNVKLPEDKDLPGYKGNETGSYVPGQQDDDDFEKVVVKIFDLALRKWVTQAIVIENGGQTVTQTGHDAWDDPEAVVKVELHRKKLSDVTVKFRYSIRVYNQGEIEGYATEITDYVPEGLKFVAEDNPGWIDEGNNVISTKLLENKLLKPGEYADVEVLLTWINSENNMGVMTNTAEISIDKNEFDLPDIDSTPDNKKPGEDDIDDAPVMLSISTGQARIYFTLGFVILMTGASGIVLIKKFVL